MGFLGGVKRVAAAAGKSTLGETETVVEDGIKAGEKAASKGKDEESLLGKATKKVAGFIGNQVAGRAANAAGYFYMADAAFDGGREFIAREFMGSSATKAQEQADGRSSGYSEGLMDAGKGAALLALGHGFKSGKIVNFVAHKDGFVRSGAREASEVISEHMAKETSKDSAALRGVGSVASKLGEEGYIAAGKEAAVGSVKWGWTKAKGLYTKLAEGAAEEAPKAAKGAEKGAEAGARSAQSASAGAAKGPEAASVKPEGMPRSAENVSKAAKEASEASVVQGAGFVMYPNDTVARVSAAAREAEAVKAASVKAPRVVQGQGFVMTDSEAVADVGNAARAARAEKGGNALVVQGERGLVKESGQSADLTRHSVRLEPTGEERQVDPRIARGVMGAMGVAAAGTVLMSSHQRDGRAEQQSPQAPNASVADGLEHGSLTGDLSRVAGRTVMRGPDGEDVSVLKSSGYMQPSEAMKMATIDTKFAAAQGGMRFNQTTDKNIRNGYDNFEIAGKDGSAAFRIDRRGPSGHEGDYDREFVAVAGPDGRGGMAMSQRMAHQDASIVGSLMHGNKDADLQMTKTVIANEPNIVGLRKDSVSGQPELTFGPRAAEYSKAIGVLSRTPNNLLTDFEQERRQGVPEQGHLFQTTGKEPTQILAFATKEKDGETVRGRVELGNGAGRLVLLGDDGKPTWAKQLPGSAVSLDSTGEGGVSAAARGDVRGFLHNPKVFAEQVGQSMDPAVLPEHQMQSIDRFSGASRMASPQIAASLQGQTAEISPERTLSPQRSNGMTSGLSAFDDRGMRPGDQNSLSIMPKSRVETQEPRFSGDSRGSTDPVRITDPQDSVRSLISVGSDSLSQLHQAMQEGSLSHIPGAQSSLRASARMFEMPSSADVVQKENSSFGDASGRTVVAAVTSRDGSRQGIFEGFTGADQNGNKVSMGTTVAAGQESTDVTAVGALKRVDRGMVVDRTVVVSADENSMGMRGLDLAKSASALTAGIAGKSSQVMDGLANSDLQNVRVRSREVFATRPEDQGGMEARSMKSEFTGLDANNNRVHGEVDRTRDGRLVMSLMSPDGRHPEFQMNFDLKQDGAKAQTALRDFLHDPQGFEQEHRAESRLGVSNAALGGANGITDSRVSDSIVSRRIDEAGSSLKNWANMGAERFAPAQNQDQALALSGSKQMRRDTGVSSKDPALASAAPAQRSQRGGGMEM